MSKSFYGVLTLVVLAVFAANVSTQTQLPPEQNAVGGKAVRVAEPGNIDPALLAGIGPNGIEEIPLPDEAYVDGTSLIDVTDPDFTVLSSLSDGTCTVDFSPSLQARTVPGSWATWGSPPFTEGSTTRLLYTQGALSVTLDFPDCPSSTFGFEAEPNPFDLREMTAIFFSGDKEVGVIVRDVEGRAGARLFAANTLGEPFTRVVFSSTADFAIARLRYALVGEPQ